MKCDICKHKFETESKPVQVRFDPGKLRWFEFHLCHNCAHEVVKYIKGMKSDVSEDFVRKLP